MSSELYPLANRALVASGGIRLAVATGAAQLDVGLGDIFVDAS